MAGEKRAAGKKETADSSIHEPKLTTAAKEIEQLTIDKAKLTANLRIATEAYNNEKRRREDLESYQENEMEDRISEAVNECEARVKQAKETLAKKEEEIALVRQELSTKEEELKARPVIEKEKIIKEPYVVQVAHEVSSYLTFK
jgi:hypothetical protein